MIETKFMVRASDDYIDCAKIETREKFPGSFLVKYKYDDTTHEWIYKLCFENDRDCTFFLLRWGS